MTSEENTVFMGLQHELFTHYSYNNGGIWNHIGIINKTTHATCNVEILYLTSFCARQLFFDLLRVLRLSKRLQIDVVGSMLNSNDAVCELTENLAQTRWQ